MFRQSCVFPRIFLILRQHSLASSKNDQQPVSVTRSALSTLKICRRGVGCRGMGKKTRFFMNNLLFAYLGLIKKRTAQVTQWVFLVVSPYTTYLSVFIIQIFWICITGYTACSGNVIFPMHPCILAGHFQKDHGSPEVTRESWTHSDNSQGKATMKKNTHFCLNTKYMTTWTWHSGVK